MISLKLAVILVVAAVAVTTCIVGTTTYYVTKNSATGDSQSDKLGASFIVDESGGGSSDAEIDGIPLQVLSEKDLKDLLDAQDEIDINDMGIDVARKIVRVRINVNYSDTTTGRQKRFIKPFMGVVRSLFSGAVKAPKPTVSGKRVTQQYTRAGDYNDARSIFNELSPDNVTPFSKNGITGQTGYCGEHTVTVRDGSKQGLPTLEIRSPKFGGENVRKFRFEDAGQ